MLHSVAFWVYLKHTLSSEKCASPPDSDACLKKTKRLRTYTVQHFRHVFSKEFHYGKLVREFSFTIYVLGLMCLWCSS